MSADNCTWSNGHKSFDRVVFELCQGVNTPRSLAVWLLYSSNEHEQLVQLNISALDYLDSHSFADDYLVTEMLQKFDGLNLDRNPKQAALDKFIECEKLCASTNRRLANDPFGRYRGIILDSKNIISRAIGEHPNFDRIIDGCGWGPGVTRSSKGLYLSWAEKLATSVTATPLLAKVSHFLFASIPGWSQQWLQVDAPSTALPSAVHVVPGNSVTTVPKNAKTERPIAVEPHLNAFFQKGIGSEIRRKLRSSGCDLNDQTRNQELARIGSIDGSLATIDLSSASDTVSERVVELLIPSDWYRVMLFARSPSYQLNARTCVYHKHSSMGNGYTFELESLIFWAVARAVCRHLRLPEASCSAYGDDIVIPSGGTALLLEVLTHLGFIPNEKKTCVNGPFRESCGKDFFRGVNVRPFYIRTVPKCHTDWFVLANKIRRYSLMRNNALGCDSRFRLGWRVCLLAVPRNSRLLGPDELGDGHFISDFDEAAHLIRPSRRRRGRLFCERYEFNSFEFVARRKVRTSMAGVLAALQARTNGPPSSDLDLQYSVARDCGRWVRRVKRVSDWPFIPWY